MESRDLRYLMLVIRHFAGLISIKLQSYQQAIYKYFNAGDSYTAIDRRRDCAAVF